MRFRNHRPGPHWFASAQSGYAQTVRGLRLALPSRPPEAAAAVDRPGSLCSSSSSPPLGAFYIGSQSLASCPHGGSYENNFAMFPGLKSVPARGNLFSCARDYRASGMLHEGMRPRVRLCAADSPARLTQLALNVALSSRILRRSEIPRPRSQTNAVGLRRDHVNTAKHLLPGILRHGIIQQIGTAQLFIDRR